MPPGSEKAIEAAAATNSWQNLLICALLLLLTGIVGGTVLLVVKSWLKKVDATASDTAEVARNSIAASKIREDNLIREISDLNLYIRNTLTSLLKETQTALLGCLKATEDMTIAMRELKRATYEQTNMLHRKIPDLASDSAARKKDDALTAELRKAAQEYKGQ